MKRLLRTHPKDKRPGAILFAGTLNKNGFIEMETTTSPSIPPLLK
jgi:cation transport ATPase